MVDRDKILEKNSNSQADQNQSYNYINIKYKNLQNVNSNPTQKREQRSKPFNKILDGITFDKQQIINDILKSKQRYPQTSAAKLGNSKSSLFTSTQSSMLGHLNKTNAQISKDNIKETTIDKGINRNYSTNGFRSPFPLLTQQDGDQLQNSQQSTFRHSRNSSALNILNETTENYRVPYKRDMTPNQNNSGTPQSRSQLKRKFTLSILNKEEKREGKKVLYSLKNAIKQDTHNKLQQLTINQQAKITHDIKQNFIPKMLNIEQTSPSRFKQSMHLTGLSGSTTSQQNLNKKLLADDFNDHQSRLLLNMQQRRQQKSQSQNFMSTDRNALSVQFQPSQDNSKVLNKEPNVLQQQQTNSQSILHQPYHKQASIHNEKPQTNNISTQFKKMAFIYQNDVHAQNIGIDQKLLMIIKILDSRAKIMKDLKTFNIDNTILQLLDIMKFSVEYDDLDLMMDVIMAMGDVYQMFGDLQSSINAFNTVRILADYTHNFKKKIESLLNLSQISKKLKQYHFSLRFIKKALQYVWEINDIDREIHIYEEIGLMFFHLYNLEKATQFHQRATNGGVEYFESNQRSQASKNLHYYLSGLENKIESIDKYILLKIPMLPFQFESQNENETPAQHIQNPYMKKHRAKLIFDTKGFKTELGEIYQIENIFSSEEFFIEIQTPRNDSQLNRFANTQEDVILRDQEEKEPEIIKQSMKHHSHNRSESQKFIPPKHLMKKSEQNTTFYLNESLKKKSLEEKIKDRVEELKLWEKRDHLGKLMNNPFKKGGHASINQIIQLNHLGVNRNIDNFEHSQNIQVTKSNMFFNKIISSQYQKSAMQGNQ